MPLWTASPTRNGWNWDQVNSRLDFGYRGTRAGHIASGGRVHFALGLTVTASGLTVTAGGLTVTAGGVTITDGGLAIRGSSRIRESLTLANVTTAGNATLTAAQLVGGLITRDPNGANRTDTTATGTQIETELAAQGMALANDDTFLCYIINTADAAETITLAGGTDVTLSNAGQTLAQNESAQLLFQRTAANTFTAYILGA